MEQAAQQATAMQINLRKANALQEVIMDTIRGIRLETNITLTEFDDVDAKLSQAQIKLMADLERVELLYRAYYDIRVAVGRVTGGTGGISDKLAAIAQAEKQIAVQTSLANQTTTRMDVNVIKGKLEKIAKGSEIREGLYARREEVVTSVIEEGVMDMLKASIANLKKVKRNLQDSLLEDNINTKITLSQGTVDTLNAEKLI